MEDSRSNIKILVAGDFCPIHRVASYIAQDDFTIFSQVKPIINICDYSIINLECPVVIDENTATPITKQGPSLKCNVKALSYLKQLGFNALTLSNNHFRDYGDVGCIDTISTCSTLSLDYIGAGSNVQSAKQILYKQIGQIKFAICNFCENEESIATSNNAGSNPLDIINNYYDIRDAKSNADYVIVITHGGHEHYQLPSIRMKKLYRFFIDAGADVVINHHQHCYSGYEEYKGKMIFYGLGNFSFDWNQKFSKLWNEGFFVILSFCQGKMSFEIYPYTQGISGAGVTMMDTNQKKEFSVHLQALNQIISSDDLLKVEQIKFYQSCFRQINNNLQPYQSRIQKALYRRGLLPDFLTTRKCINLRNYVSCESHRDVLLYYLESKINE